MDAFNSLLSAVLLCRLLLWMLTPTNRIRMSNSQELQDRLHHIKQNVVIDRTTQSLSSHTGQ